MDVLSTTHRTEIARQAIKEALRDGLLSSTEATKLRKNIGRTAQSLPQSTDGSKATANESATS
jgi:hypothetical protein